MNDKLSWDHSLVKKYSSSNHLKLLNQLKNEVIKYPLNNKKNSLINTNNEFINDNKKNPTTQKTKDNIHNNNSLPIKEKNNKVSTVSFNNSKNFSIYNTTNNESKKEQQDNINIDSIYPNEDQSISTFKDRLNQIDMK